MKQNTVVCYFSALQSLLAVASSAQAQTAAAPVVPYNLGDAVRAAESARREQPPMRRPNVELPQTVERHLTLQDNEKLFIRQIKIEGPELAGAEEARQIVAQYENRKLTLTEIYEAADKITNLYRSKGYLVAKAYVPEQDARGGELKIKVIPGRYGAVKVENKSLVRSDFLRNTIDRALGGSPYIHKNELERAMLLESDLPGAGAPRIAISPGKELETSDFVFSPPGGRRIEGYLLSDNYGSPYTGRQRTSGAFTLNSPTGYGDRLSVFGIVSNLGGLVNGRIAYAPPPTYGGLRSEVSVFETYYKLSDVYKDSGATGVANGFSVNLIYPFKRQRDESVYLFSNFTHKFLNDKILGFSTSYRYIDLGTVGVTRDTFGTLFDMPYVTDTTLSATSGYLRFPDPEELAANRLGVNTAGIYGRVNLNANATMAISPLMSLSLAFRAQKSLKGNLDSSEKFSLTGNFGVRSYDEGFAGDSGFLATPELRYALPAFERFQHSLGAFSDVGAVWLENASYTTTQKAFSPLSDVGLGYYASYDLAPYVSTPAQSIFFKAQVAHSVAWPSIASTYNKYTKGLFQLGLTFAAAGPPSFAAIEENASPDKGAANFGARPDTEKLALADDARAAAAKLENKMSYYVPTRAYRLEPAPDIPPYVRNLGKTYKEFEGIDWLNVGLDSRVRFEYRQNDYRPWTDTTKNPPTSQRKYFPNSLWLSRTRVYLGIQNILDPFRAVVEFQDSRAFNSIYQYQGQEINQTDLISAYGELYFKDAFGKDERGNDRPLTARAGRFHLELLDKRLIAENEFRNTTNTFDGFRVKIGKKENDWDLDNFVMHPIIRDPYSFDRPDWQNWIYGSVFSVRRWSEYATIQPYFLGRKQYADPYNGTASAKVHRDTYAPGLRIYGVLNNFDYDFDLNKQFGEVGDFRALGAVQNAVQTTVQQDAIAYAMEVGYTFPDHPWKPRISVNYAYGSGSKSPFDSVNQTVDTFYGFNQPFSRNDYFAWNNVKASKARLEFSPSKNLQIDTAFSAYWLASAAAAWDRANLVAPLGNRGTFVGAEVDVRARYKLSQFVNLSASYARFWPGSFTSSFAPPVALQQYFPQSFSGQTTTTNGLTAKPTDFFYLEVTANGFGDGKPITKNLAIELVNLASPGAPPAPPASWNDVYVGLNGGGAWSSPLSNVRVAPISTAPPSAPVAAASNILDSKNHLAGFVGGLQLGANWRFAKNIVAGFEADLHGVSGNTDTKWQATAVSSIDSTFINYGQRTATLNYLGTIRARLGYLVTPTVQLYGTGGMAYGGVTSNTALLTKRAGGASITQANPLFQETRMGWTVGGGVEWMFMPNWSAKAEYLRYDLGVATASAIALHPSGFYRYAASTRTNFDGSLIQAGVNRHFDLVE